MTHENTATRLKTVPPSQDAIRISGARENNLQNLTVSIPKRLITIFTGVSGSGKSSLVFDTIAAESQRQLNETFNSFVRHRLPHYGQPDADLLENLSAAIVVDQKRLGGNSRSTVGTATDISSLLRLLYSRVGKPFVGYSNIFSFNHPQGMCPQCEGLGVVSMVDVEGLINRNKSLNEGAIRFPTYAPGTWQWKRYVYSGLFDNDRKIKDYTPDDLQLLLYQKDLPLENPPPEWPRTARYQGVVPRFTRSYLTREASDTKTRHREAFERVATHGTCPACHGARLNPVILSCRIEGRNIAECSSQEISELIPWIRRIDTPISVTMVAAIAERLQHLEAIGLGYLTLDRETSSLSGGESQRVKMVRHLGSSLTDMTYIFDEPSIGLHPRDVSQLNTMLRRLRDKGNTVLVVEHDPDVIAIADHVIDMGPGAGTNGGRIVYEGSLAGLSKAKTLTSQYLSRQPRIKTDTRQPQGWLTIKHASLHNLRNVSVDIPRGVMTVVTGVAGSGKSSLINGVFTREYPETIAIDQGGVGASGRSNAATYIGILDPIRKLFASANKVSAALFSSNSKGACPECRGLGVTYTELAFMDPIVSVCEVCEGRRFTKSVLRHEYRGKNISDVLALRVSEAKTFFDDDAVRPPLLLLSDVGLDYLTLGQPLNTLSGGERQRLKLATELQNAGQIYVLDEPTTGLHMSDVERLIGLLDRLVANGSTVIVIEHNLEVIARADWIVDLGPGAGHDGGQIMFQGGPEELVSSATSATSHYLRQYTRGQGPIEGAHEQADRQNRRSAG